jgi:hypothetical protein
MLCSTGNYCQRHCTMFVTNNVFHMIRYKLLCTGTMNRHRSQLITAVPIFNTKNYVSDINYHSNTSSFSDLSRVHAVTSVGHTHQLYATVIYSCDHDHRRSNHRKYMKYIQRSNLHKKWMLNGFKIFLRNLTFSFSNLCTLAAMFSYRIG